jgi:hypothetical protein
MIFHNSELLIAEISGKQIINTKHSRRDFIKNLVKDVIKCTGIVMAIIVTVLLSIFS